MHKPSPLRTFYTGGTGYSIVYKEDTLKKIPYDKRLEIILFIENNIQECNKDDLRERAEEKFHIPISLETEGIYNVFTINKESA